MLTAPIRTARFNRLPHVAFSIGSADWRRYRDADHDAVAGSHSGSNLCEYCTHVAPISDRANCGDRGLVQLMRGDTANAEIDFKKCFELDSSLEPQFKTAANQLKQRTVSRYLHEKPADVEITKFSWTEAPAKELLAPSSAPITVTTSAVSPTGTRVLANPGVKGDPGPGEILNPSGITTTTTRPTEEKTRSFIDYKFSISLKNAGNKTIAGVTWAYFFEPKNPSSESLSYLFTSKTSIAPEKEKTLNESLNSSRSSANSNKLPSKHNQALYTERAAIIRLEYADGTSWQSAAKVSESQKNSQP